MGGVNQSDDILFPRPPLAGDESGEANSVGDYSMIEVPMSAFLAFPAVVEWLEAQNISDPVNTSATVEGQGALLYYLPARLTIEFDARAIAGSLGKAAAGGYVAFNLYNGYAASWTIVMDMTGALQQISPAISSNSIGMSHFCALKNKDEETLLLVSSVNESASGAAFLWSWRTGDYKRIAGTEKIWGTHDAQWAAHGLKEALWTLQASHTLPVDHCGYNQNVTLVTVDTGEILHTLHIPGTSCDATAPDVNHAQILGDDSIALVSERNWNGIAKYLLNFSHENGGTLAWRLGGEQGMWPITSIDGAITYNETATVWGNQHNPEFIDDDEICMFDCTGLGNESRLLTVKVNETNQTARLTWEHRLGVLSSVFGDCDPMPSGNLLASYWNSNYTNATGDGPYGQAVAGLIEVVRANDGKNAVAWHMRVYGDACPSNICNDNSVAGWHMYSVERFYDAPLLPSPGSAMGEPACAYEDGQLVLHFTAYNSFKQNSKAPGTYSLTQTAPGLDQVVAEGAFAFEPFWRPTKVMGVPVKLADPSSREVRLEVMNERGRSTAYVFNCTR